VPDRAVADPAAPDRPEVVCLCGSVRFAAELRAANRALTLAGAIVLAPTEWDGPLTGAQRAALGELHLRRIDLADRVLVVNPGGYVGEATRREIAHARATGTPVAFTHADGVAPAAPAAPAPAAPAPAASAAPARPS